MTKIKSIPAEKIKILIEQLNKFYDFVETEREPWVSVGYTKSSIKTIIKQLKGEFPIL